MPDTENDVLEAAFDTWSVYREHLLDTLQRAKHGLILFDHDLAQTGLESSAAIEALDALARSLHGDDRIRILVRTPVHIERHCPRLLKLVERFGQRIRIRVVGESVTAPDSSFAVADPGMLVTRFHRDRPRGKRVDGPSPESTRYTAQFETMWISARNGPTGAPLGI